ncbi:MAG: 16S rRNA (uracil(1498)-N(3))-methyltransferase [Niameybacter sp.]|uniref:16S rRNA (uracil(1498)-N(3))-methyltransferase n=1 Tax=Niameybacter sp. TaxID=2033640 RepID=UPI002FC677C6
MPKFFVKASNILENEIIIDDENVNHMKNVLRLQMGDEIIINDRQGHDYKCIINAIESSKIRACISSVADSSSEPSIEVTLFQSLIKGEKMEWVIQKAVEIGVTRIVPLCTSRCVVKIENPKKMASKVERWNKIAESAAKQSGRGMVPEVTSPMDFNEGLEFATEKGLFAVIPYEKEHEQGIRQILKNTSSHNFGLFIGPEGGFTEEEVQEAIRRKVHSVSLGSRILRSETASLVTLTNIMYEMGEMD